MSLPKRRDHHINSLLAWYEGREDLFAKRELAVLEALRASGRATDREVMLKLGFSDMNSVRPRITELVAEGLIEEVGSQTDPVTGKQVRIVAVATDPRKAQRTFEFAESA